MLEAFEFYPAGIACHFIMVVLTPGEKVQAVCNVTLGNALAAIEALIQAEEWGLIPLLRGVLRTQGSNLIVVSVRDDLSLLSKKNSSTHILTLPGGYCILDTKGYIPVYSLRLRLGIHSHYLKVIKKDGELIQIPANGTSLACIKKELNRLCDQRL